MIGARLTKRPPERSGVLVAEDARRWARAGEWVQLMDHEEGPYEKREVFYALMSR